VHLRYDGAQTATGAVRDAGISCMPICGTVCEPNAPLHTKGYLNTMKPNTIIIMLGMAMLVSTCAQSEWWLDGLWDGAPMMGSDVWHLVALNGQAIDAEVRATMQYENNNLVGEGFCMVYRVAPYVTSATTFRIDQVATFDVPCPEPRMADAQAFLVALQATTHIQRTDNTLLFLSDQEQALLVFAQ